ncbi:MAG: hypothetical protein QNL62_14685 [Gammaproteobacteria bacterium]|nr:hypothetical protein [Gammaproteobacteria bacterium]
MNEKPQSNKNIPKHPLNEIQDEDFFTQYVQRKSRLSDLYKKAQAAEPSDKLNQAILTAARKQSSRNWWSKPGSWAATVALISLIGLLTHNTWQEKQNRFQQSPLQKPIEQRSDSAPQARNVIQPEEKKDSRKLIFKSAPAPVLKAAPGNLLSDQADNLITEDDIDSLHWLSTQTHQIPDATMEVGIKAKQPSAHERDEVPDDFSNPQQWLQKIKHLIEHKQIEQARKLLARFKEKYPNYPVDTVILQHLPPY